MDERVLKWITIMMSVLTVVVLIGLQGFPDLHAKAVMAAEQQEELKGGSLIATAAPAQIVKEDETLHAQLKIGLPAELKKEDVQIENDYVTQTVYIRFPGGTEDYFQKYKIRGSSDHIASLSYYKDGEDGVIALTLDKVYELSQKYRKGGLYLDFIDPHDIYDKVVVIDAGHGSRAAGAVKLGVSEKDIDLDILLQLKKLFDACPDNIGVYYTRTTDTNPTLDQRVQLANKADADLFISVHCNSYEYFYQYPQ